MSSRSKNRGNKSKKRTKKQSELSKILSSSKKEIQVNFNYFQKLSPNAIRENVNKVAFHPYFKSAVSLSHTNDYSSIYTQLTPDTDLIKSINWAVGILVYHKETINQFAELEKEITEAILNEEYARAIICLDEIDDLCGISTWSVSVRASIYKISDNYEKLQEYLENLNRKSGSNSFFKTMCRNMSNRYDDSALTISSGMALKTQITRTIQENLQSFLIYKLVPRDFHLNYEFNYVDIFNYEKNSSIVDLLKAVVEFMAYVTKIDDEDIRKAGAVIAKRLSPFISYGALKGLSCNFGVIYDWSYNSDDYEIIDLYSAGKYKEVCEKGKNYSGKYINFTSFELIAKSSARIGYRPLDGIKNCIMNNLIDILLKEDDYKRSLLNMQTLCHAFSWIPWFQELHYLISRESSFVDEKTHEHFVHLSSSFSEVDSPRKVEILPVEMRDKYFELCNKTIPESISIKLFEILQRGTVESLNESEFSGLEENRLKKYKAKALIKYGDIKNAIKILKELSTSDDRLVVYESTKLLVDSLFDIEMYENSLDVFVDSVLKNSNLVLNFNTHRICSVAKKIRNISASISIPIALSLHSRHVDSDYDSTLRYSFEKFLDKNSLKHPTDLVGLESKFGVDKVNYFLEYVCTPDIMKLSFKFNDKREIEDCRIAICSYLIEKGISKSSLVNEVKDITKEQVLRKAITHVDHSRIHADLSGFSNSRSSRFRDVFKRYLELKNNDYSTYEDEVTFEKLWHALSEDSLLRDAHILHVLDLTINEKNATFHKLINMLRDEFTFGHKGLNSYISTRIRHGVLPGTIRKCVSDENLVTPIDEKTKKPKSNIYWQTKFQIIGEDEIDNIDKALKRFTIDYEGIISEINDEWLQVVSLDQDITNLQKGGAKINAVFDYSMSNLETYSLQKILVDDDYDSFVRIISKWLWQRTDDNLKTIIEKITITAKNKLLDCYAELLSSLDGSVENRNDIEELYNAINRSKDSLNIALDLIASWFTRSDVGSVEEFDIETAIEIASRPLNVKVEVGEGSNEIVFNGKYLSCLVDIFYILFENAVTKSNLSKNEIKIKVNIDFIRDKTLSLLVSNNCKLNGSIEEIEKGLNFYRDAYGNEDLIANVVQKEGGTGFFKIWKILSKDIEVKHSIEFGYEGDDEFFVKINIKEPREVIRAEIIVS